MSCVQCNQQMYFMWNYFLPITVTSPQWQKTSKFKSMEQKAEPSLTHTQNCYTNMEHLAACKPESGDLLVFGVKRKRPFLHSPRQVPSLLLLRLGHWRRLSSVKATSWPANLKLLRIFRKPWELCLRTEKGRSSNLITSYRPNHSQ